MKLRFFWTFAAIIFAVSSANASCTETNSDIALGWAESPHVSAWANVDSDCKAWTFISIDGPLERSTFRAINAAMLESMSAGVFTDRMVFILNSPGGDLDGAYLSALGMHGATTVILEDGQCASACTILFAAGENRVIAKGGLLGIHSAYYSGSGEQALLGNIKVVNFLESQGVKHKRVMELMNTTPGTDMVWLNAQNTKALGFATRIAN
ncbi:Clp protease/crotonase-like domain-containing protein [Ruegeria profundi]|uniref:hypothetical protein n=1 Tax=Ruegeria profundi TaxID=1685378 RepID=UPI001CD36AC8|nr:hypothetical protein [Ruegeria profundi]MCA0927154.1 hypothetical protein [Ruegeria profundi]